LIYDTLAVNSISDCFAEFKVVKGGNLIVETDVEDVEPFAGIKRQVGVSLNGRNIIRTWVVNTIDGSSLEFEQTLG
jgi:hypothetical protein